MQNLAGVPAPKSNPIVVRELKKAGVKPVETTFTKGMTPEVPATFIGFLGFEDGTFVTFSRLWYYWSVRSSTFLAFVPAKALNDSMGSVVRVEGFAGGTDVRLNGCASWHVDTQEGLNTLVQVLKEHFGKPDKRTPSVSELARMKLLNNAIYG
ncbi:MAG: hypothetical protein WC654_07690 [Patescibacteria group bacterium]